MDNTYITTLSQIIGLAHKLALEAIAQAVDSKSLRILKNGIIGKKGTLSQLRSQLGSIADLDTRKAAGQLINDAVLAIEIATTARLESLVQFEVTPNLIDEYIDLTEFLTPVARGHAHIVTQTAALLENIFIGMGFQIADGPEVETEFYNFEALNMPKSHPARSAFDTFFLDSTQASEHDSDSILLRTHTSPVQIRVMQTWDLPIYAIMPGRVFRRDTPDATHVPVFHQIEGLVVDRDITFAHLAGTIEAFTKAFFGSDFTSRLRPSYFPFTAPSAEFDIRDANGDWLELGGGGMVHPDVLRTCGIDPGVFTGFAFGFGIDRMAKERHKVEDVREMYTNDLRFIRQF
jgi:phenylalanyl-tRNA synthetase alpha chain